MSINQMVIAKGGKSTLRLKMHGSHLTCKDGNKCLNVCKRVKVVEKNKDGLRTYPAAM